MERFQRDLTGLSKEDRIRCLELLLALSGAVGEPHRHSGMGLRKLHRSGVYEARVGLGLRVVFALRDEQAVLVTVGSHDKVRKYLASL
jgi:mRNA-degrading endonuclease RelE of RelBE toxin-antitoxin system